MIMVEITEIHFLLVKKKLDDDVQKIRKDLLEQSESKPELVITIDEEIELKINTLIELVTTATELKTHISSIVTRMLLTLVIVINYKYGNMFNQNRQFY